MLDWLTLRYDWGDRVFEIEPRLRAVFWQNPLVVCMRQATGEILWTTAGRESIRSDSHQVTVEVSSSSITVQGSPARALGLSHNVFGPDSLHVCARAMLRHVRRELASFGIHTPCYRAWKITRCDVTENFVFARPGEVRQALAYLRQYDAGRYKVGTKSETVMWSTGSRLRSGKAYHKGPHLTYQMGKQQCQVTSREITLAEHLLRLELALRAEWWRRVRVNGIAAQWRVDLKAEYENYWNGLIGTCEVSDMSEREAITEAAKRHLTKKGKLPRDGGERYGRAAYATWCMVSAMGHKLTQENLPPATWYRHLAVFKEAGLSWGDIAAGKVIPLRREPLLLRQPAKSFADVERQIAVLQARAA